MATRFANDPFWGRYFAAVCQEKNKGKCVCSADVVYPVLIGKDKSPAVNKAMKKIADGYACTAGMAITQLRYEVTFNAADIFSVVFDGYGRAYRRPGQLPQSGIADDCERRDGAGVQAG